MAPGREEVDRDESSQRGQRFLMVKRGEAVEATAGRGELIFVQHWFEELTRLVPTE